ncbi:adenine phosphoribosyltransferase [Natrarchaeobius halalkaliphilus]|uniref:Adenine phosphoribosyltransferase n=1 Tax=Natrarchaeobius halalkaliphilus TaxID=1679091 RepID=A0A3N6P222_9EURY|nr:hypoxanthine/guanine phosphoribosyltransferase [Natrarchaeobius halalkaliphilus]RQG91609.1 adenine phosphoribosyltransferase [Natrarchaeobius halalkaliphilus]
MDPSLEPLTRSLREAPIVDRNGYEYFVHGVTDGILSVEPDVLRAVADAIIDRVDLESVDRLVVPEAMGIHHGTALSLATDIPFVVVRKRSYGFPAEVAIHQETSYGEDELFVNGVDADDRVVIVDDVLSSGGTVDAVCAGLETIGAEIVDVVTVLRRVDVDRAADSRDVTSVLDVRIDDGEVVIVD